LYAQKGIYNVRQFIKNTGKSVLITKELQSLIDRCSNEGGGKIYFPAGDYLTGSLILKDNTFLELGAGATLYGSMDINDYTEEGGMSLIYADGAENIGLAGHGTLNGNGDFYWRGKERPYIRPDRFILLENCRNIRIDGISMLNSPNWNLELRNCDFAWINGISMISDKDSPNTDGIDPVSTSNVFISNCYFELGDDAICPKSRGTKPTENIVVENCIIKSDDSAIKLGTRSEAPIRNLVFNNIVIRDTQYGIAFFAKDGGTFQNIRFSNITIESSLNEQAKDDKPSGSYPLFLDIERRRPGGPISYINDIHFSDITINSKDGHCLFLGQPDQRIKNLYFSNINFYLKVHRTLEGSKKPRGVRSLTDRAANDYSHIPANFTFAYVQGIRINNLTISDFDSSGKYERHMVWGYDVHDVEINGFRNKLAVPNKELALLYFKESTLIDISSCIPTGMETSFLFLEGNSTKAVTVHHNNLSRIQQDVQSDGNVEKDEIVVINNIITGSD
jgi:polygalacturonase